MIVSSGSAGLVLWLLLSALFLLVLLVIFRLSAILAFYRAQRWLTQNKAVVHEYAVTTDLSAVEFGYLFDRKFRDDELLALLLWPVWYGYVWVAQ